MTDPSDTGAAIVPRHDADDVGPDPRCVVLLWDPEWAEQVSALRSRSGDTIRLGLWVVTAALDGGFIVEGPAPMPRFDAGPRQAAKVVEHMRAFARRATR